MKKYDEFINEELSKSNRIWEKEPTLSIYDWVYNEVLTWLMDQMKASTNKFTYTVFDSGTIDFNSQGGITIRVESKSEMYGHCYTKSFSINNDLIYKYNIQGCKYNDREAFRKALQYGWYKNYTVTGAKIGDKWVELGFKNYKDLKLKEKIWKAIVDSGDYLKRDIDMEKIIVDKTDLTYEEVVKLPKTIISLFKKSMVFKSFIKGESKDKLKTKLVAKSIKAGLSIESVVNFLESTKTVHTNTKLNNSGPWATTGTDEFVDSFDISKLQAKFPDTDKYIMDNMSDIFKGLQKKKYSHSLGYYTFKNARIRGKFLDISASSTTYYN